MKTYVSEIAASLAVRLAEESLAVDFLPASRVIVEPDDASVPDHDKSEDLKGGLDALEQMVSECQGCDLAGSRTRTVFGEGPSGCMVMFIGEAPGAEEDAAGRPFVGPSGQLLDRMIKAMGLAREECYIANVVKCRPSGNVTPSVRQSDACFPYLRRQIELIRPRMIVALGRVAADAMTGRTQTIARLRGRWHKWENIPFVVTYHPAALLRDPSRKRLAWEDLQLVMARMSRVVA